VYKKRIRVEMEYDFEWVNLEDILDITFEWKGVGYEGL
jgi:hypothetical protein